VQAKIESFQTVTGYNGNIHRPNYLKVVWGTLQVKRCVLKSASIAYKLFKPDGIPLRAIITANFTDNSDDTTRVAMAQDSSPDLTHVRLVKSGDTLPKMCYDIYGDPGYYLDVAMANKLNNFRNLQTGTKIFFPPLEK
jgi:nucleoid-associated protein YgaU